MNDSEKEVPVIDQVELVDLLPEIETKKIRQEILKGLQSENKYISSKFFYDELGSNLFEQITRLKEYYPTRTEKSILKNIATQIVSDIEHTDIIELGSGDCSKINLLVREIPKQKLPSITYIPIDVSKTAIQKSMDDLLELYPKLNIRAYVADFMKPLHFLPSDRKRLFCFFGSTIGNLEKHEAELLIKNISRIMNAGDKLLLGMDMVKDRTVLHNAYNDSKNVTAQFNKNILHSVNDSIGSNLKPGKFKHLAFFNEEKLRIEMHLEALEDISLYGPSSEIKIEMKKGEQIHTENSHKYTVGQICVFASIANLKINQIYSDAKKWFSVVAFEK